MAQETPSPAPWDAVPPEKQLFVLITGANSSGVGLGFCQLLIDRFLTTRSRDAHLVLIPTTRSATKSRETIAAIRSHLARSSVVRSHGRAEVERRVHLLSIQIDLCDLRAVYAAARRLLDGCIDCYPPSSPSSPATAPVRIPRLDAVVFNAGFGGWTGLDWPGMARMLLREGLMQTLTWPDFKVSPPGAVRKQRLAEGGSDDAPALGEVFCANVFGHYLFSHELMPLLSRAAENGDHGDPRAPALPRGRIVWTSSIEPAGGHFEIDDLQGLLSSMPYESSKRLTDVLALTARLPGVARYSDPYFAVRDPAAAARLPVRPRVCLTHPGIVASTLFPLAPVLFVFYQLAMCLARWLGSPWHPVWAYEGSYASVWAVLQEEDGEGGDEKVRERETGRPSGTGGIEGVKWGSSADRLCRMSVKKTEVEGWGWEGTVETAETLARDPARGGLRKTAGRKADAVDVTRESRQEFEALGARCWAEMEKLRAEWEERLGVAGVGGAADGRE